MAKINIQLSEDEIEQLINGETISVPTNLKTKGDVSVREINIMQSPIKDIAAPIINRDKKVISKSEEENMITIHTEEIRKILERDSRTPHSGVMRLSS